MASSEDDGWQDASGSACASVIPERRRTDEIVAAIKGWISAGRMRPGDALPNERALIAHFGAARGSVREALGALRHQGLVRTRRGARGGAEVAAVSYERTAAFLRGYLYFDDLTWEQIYALRAAIEPPIAREVTPQLDADDLTALERTIEACVAREAEGDFEGLRQAEIAFHAILARRCGNPLMAFSARFVVDLMSEMTITRNIIDPGGDRFHAGNVAAHRALVAAFRAGDAERAERLMARHVEEAGCFVCAREGDRSVGLRL